MDALVGREEEKSRLQEALDSGSPELIAVFGRRRVGKTFLVRQYCKDQLAFEFTGARDAGLAEQLENFQKALQKATGRRLYKTPGKWSEAFDQLTDFLERRLKKERTVIFLDEFPWLNTHKSGFLSAFDHWWNSWGNQQTRLVVIICGSAAAWMIQHIVNNKGGLHNRITRKIRLMPFNLRETAAYFRARNIQLDHYQIIQLYMVMGGVPHYLKEVRKGESAAQTIDRVCFTKDGALQGEFANLYHSLFEDASRHIAVVKALAKTKRGLTRSELIEAAQFTSGGWVTDLLGELIESGFVSSWSPFDKKTKDSIYKLSDEFTHFYLKFMDGSKAAGAGSWQSFSSSASWRSWSGLAFERCCLKHVPQIKKALGIGGVYTEESAWRHLPRTKKEQGAQIDLLIDRKDFVINLCEIKFSEQAFVIDKKYAAELENKRMVFKTETDTRKSVFLTLITSFGLKENEYAIRLVQNTVTMESLFQP